MSSSGVSCFFAQYITSRCLCSESCGLLGRGFPYEKNSCNVSIHGDDAGTISMPGIIIASEVDSYNFCAFPVCSDLVVFLEGLEDMEGVFFSHIFDAKVVNE